MRGRLGCGTGRPQPCISSSSPACNIVIIGLLLEVVFLGPFRGTISDLIWGSFRTSFGDHFGPHFGPKTEPELEVKFELEFAFELELEVEFELELEI